jgi:hypothetical protein
MKLGLKKMKSKVIILLCVLYASIIGSNLLNAQENCAVNLKRAQELFSSGQIEEVPVLIEPCLESGFTKEEKIQAYKILINAYVFDDNLEKAEITMLDFLKKYPEYETISTDPSEFVNLMQQFDNRPRFSIGFIAGGTYSVIRVIEPVNTSPLNDNFGYYNTSGVSYHVGFSFIKNLTSKLELSIEADFKNAVFDHYLDPNSFTSNSYYEAQQLINLPVSLCYSLGKGKIYPFARLGFNTGFLVSSGADLISVPGVESPRISNIDNRETLCFWGIIGGGVRLKISKAYLFADVRYNLALNNQVNNNGRRNTQGDELWLYQYRDDDFYHDDLNLSIGYVRTIYKPRKKTD